MAVDNLTISPVPQEGLQLQELVYDYWWELMRTASTVKDEASRAAYFQQRFRVDGDEPPYWAMVDEKPIGFFHFSSEGRTATITDFYVCPEARRQGVGSSMLRWMLDRFDRQGITRIDLTVRRDTPMAHAFWEAQGFTIAHHEMQMYRDPEQGVAYSGALSSDFSEDDLGYAAWKARHE